MNKADSQKQQQMSELDEIRYAIDQHSIYVETDVKGTIVDVNRRFCEVSGYQESELVGQNHRLLNSGLHSTQFWRDMYSTIANGDVWRGDICNRTKLGELYWVTTTIIPKKNASGKVIGYRALRTEITDQVRQRHRLEAILDKQKDMFAVIGHELRTPVAAITMLTNDDRISPDEKLTQIKEISDSLLHVLEDLRVVVAPERALEVKKTVDDPVKVVARAVSPLTQLARANNVTLQLDVIKPEGSFFELNGQALRQSVTNLVKNALIHSGGTQVWVSFNFEITDESVASAVLRVEDDGTGIPLHLRDHVFEAFGRGNTQVDGSGLGLFIVKQIAQTMGGELLYSEGSAGGACFELCFPMTAISTENLTELPVDCDLNGLRVLLAEDEKLLRMLTEKMLAKEGATVSSYENGRLALNAFRPEAFDLVITDLMMPEMNGHELTKAIRGQSSDTLVIAVTAAVLGEETTKFIEEGANAVLPKPLSVRALKAAINEIRRSG